MIRNCLLALPIFALLAACSNEEDLYANALDRWTGSATESDARVAQLASSNSTVLQVAFFEISARGVLLLEGRRDGYETWVSGEGATLILNDGFVVGARGVGSGLMASDVSESRSAVYGRQNVDVLRFHSFLTENDEIETRSYKCAIENGDRQEITIVDRRVNALVMRESCRSLDQEFLNIYWLDPSGGKIIQSRQWLGGDVGVVVLREVAVQQ